MAAERFDYDLVWKMHKLTGEFARALNLHNLDGGDYAGINDAARSDDDRRGFWQLIQTDLYIRLLLDKPPAVTADSWKVNLPWLNSQGPPEGVQAMSFLISSRVTMVLMRFFVLLDDAAPRPKSELRLQTEALCHEIEQLFVDWQAVRLSCPERPRETDCETARPGHEGLSLFQGGGHLGPRRLPPHRLLVHHIHAAQD